MTNNLHILMQALGAVGKEEKAVYETIDNLNDQLQVAYSKLRKIRKTEDEITLSILAVLQKRRKAT